MTGVSLPASIRLFKRQEVLLALLGDEAHQLLLREERAHRGEDLALKAAKPAVSAFAAYDDERALRRKGPAQVRQGPPPAVSRIRSNRRVPSVKSSRV